jgi:hypothetical protein
MLQRLRSAGDGRGGGDGGRGIGEDGRGCKRGGGWGQVPRVRQPSGRGALQQGNTSAAPAEEEGEEGPEGEADADGMARATGPPPPRGRGVLAAAAEGFWRTTARSRSTAVVCAAGFCANLLTGLAWGLLAAWARDGLRLPGAVRNRASMYYSSLKGVVQVFAGAASDRVRADATRFRSHAHAHACTRTHPKSPLQQPFAAPTQTPHAR